MESNPIPPRLPEPAVTQAREAGQRQEGRRRFDEERRKAFRRARGGDAGGTAEPELELSPEAIASRERTPPRERAPEGDTAEESLDVRGRRLDIRV